jgi:hypothetical protein
VLVANQAAFGVHDRLDRRLQYVLDETLCPSCDGSRLQRRVTDLLKARAGFFEACEHRGKGVGLAALNQRDREPRDDAVGLRLGRP